MAFRFPAKSEIVTVTGTVCPGAMIVPADGLCPNPISPRAVQLSVATTSRLRSGTRATHEASVATVRELGQNAIMGGVSSMTVTVKVQLTNAPLESVAV